MILGGITGEMSGGLIAGVFAALPMPLGSFTDPLSPAAFAGPGGTPLTPASWASAPGAARRLRTETTRNTIRRSGWRTKIEASCLVITTDHPFRPAQHEKLRAGAAVPDVVVVFDRGEFDLHPPEASSAISQSIHFFSLRLIVRYGLPAQRYDCEHLGEALGSPDAVEFVPSRSIQPLSKARLSAMGLDLIAIALWITD